MLSVAYHQIQLGRQKKNIFALLNDRNPLELLIGLCREIRLKRMVLRCVYVFKDAIKVTAIIKRSIS